MSIESWWDPQEEPMAVHKVAQGECVQSVANQYGFFWETLWKHPDNASLRKLRKDPFTLFPGDQIHVPDNQVKSVACATTRRHPFRVKNASAVLNLVLQWYGEPRADEPYELEIDGVASPGTTDGDGHVQCAIPPRALRAKLTIGTGARRTNYTIELGALHPVDTVTGVKGRLKNLGCFQGPVDASVDDAFRGALAAFQCTHELDLTSEIDGPTQDKLTSLHGE